MSSSDLSTIREEKSYADATVAFLIASALVVVLESVITACFIQAALSRWGYDTFRSRGLLVVGASCMVSFLCLWLSFSVISARLSGRSLNQKLTRHCVVFLPFSFLVFYPFLPEYNRQNIAVLYFVTAAGLSGVLALFLLRESWLQRDARWPKRIFNVATLGFLVFPLVVVFGSIKFHDRYLIRLLDSEITRASVKLADESYDSVSVAVRVTKVPGKHSITMTVPERGVLHCAALSNTDFFAAGAPISYRVEVAAGDADDRFYLEGKIGPGKIAWMRRDLSSLAGKKSAMTFQMEEPFSIGSVARRLHTLFHPSLWAPGSGADAKTRVIPAYWSESVLYEPRKKEEVNVLLIIVDTLRADHLGCYGYTLNTTPTIDELARGGVLFKEAVSQSPWTLPSIASIYTGRLPSSHLAGRKDGLVFSPEAKLCPQPNYISLLKDGGFYTVGFVSNPYLTPGYGMDLGFQEYYSNNMTNADSSEFACRWFESNADKKFFCLLHYLHPHEPYRLHENFVFEHQEQSRFGFQYSDSHLKLLAKYDSEIAYTDSRIRTVLDKLKDLDLFENTLIIFTSDHGEEFYEHGGESHGHAFYDELVHVPLILHLPASLPAGKTVRQQVRLADILPTTFDILGIDSGEEFVGGKSLLPLLSAENTMDSPPAISEFLRHAGSQKKSIRHRGYKLIYDPETGRTELYDVSTDPGEMVDLSEAEPEIREDLLRRLRESIEENQSRFVIEAEPASPTQETKNALRALGYLD